MSKFTGLTALVATLGVFSAPAHAQDWAGSYLGAGFTHSANTAEDTTFGSGSFDVDGNGISVFGGHNWQSGQMVFGVEGAVLFSGAQGDDGDFQTPFDEGNVTTVMGRVGYDAGKVLPWLGLGWQQAKTETTHGTGSTEVEGTTFSGGLAALGVDYAIAEDGFLRLSVERANFGTEEQGFFGGSDIHETTYEATRVSVGVAMKF
jgi:outer membrane immunogenic protein